MESYLKQIMQARGKFLKKLINLTAFSILSVVIFFSKNLAGDDVGSKIDKYVNNLNYFSSKFIQSNGTSLEEGRIYIKDNKIRLDYFLPNRSLILSKNKGVYINHELKEEEFFSTQKNIVGIFYDIFLDKNYFSKLTPKKKSEEIVFEKIISINSTKTNLRIFFENKPIILRKITAESENEIISISFNEHNYNSILDDDLFSFVPIYLD